MKKLLLIAVSLALILQSLPVAAAATPSRVVYDEFANVTVTIGSKDFNVYTLKKTFRAVPYTSGTATFVQADAILPWLGYTVNYNSKSRVLTASSTTQKCTVKASSLTYTVNGKTLKFIRTPKYAAGTLMVPMEELFKSLGYTVKSDKLSKKVSLTKFKGYAVGSFAFYDKSTDIQNFYRFDNKGIYNEAYKDVTINQLYSHDGVIVGYVYDKLKRFNKLVKYENGKFVDLKQNFDIVSTYEFGDSRVFYGYDNADKEYKLYRFNDAALVLVVDDCYSSVQINFKDSIILNKYDSNRNYSVIKVDKDWLLTELDTKKTMTEYFISDNWLYMKAKPQEGAGIYFLVFNGTSIVKVTISSGSSSKPDEDIDFDRIRICDGKVYAILPTEIATGTYTKVTRGKLYLLEESKATMLPFDQYDSDITLIESYNGKLYLSGSHTSGKSALISPKLYSTFEYTPGGSYTIIQDPRLDGKNLKFEKSLVEYGTLFLTGKVVNIESKTTEDVMYAYKAGVWNYAMDITSIESVIQTDNGLYLKVKDYDRATPNTKRDSVLFINNELDISNAAIDFSITNQAVVGSALVFAGANKITKRSGVNRHDVSYTELIPGFIVTYWEPVNGQVFTGGKQDLVYSLYNITSMGVKEIKENFDAKTVLATGDSNLYLVYGIERDKTSMYYNIRVLYLYNMQKGTFTLVTAGIDIKQIIKYK